MFCAPVSDSEFLHLVETQFSSVPDLPVSTFCAFNSTFGLTEAPCCNHTSACMQQLYLAQGGG